MRIALGVQYDGSAYCGWQIQPDQATVQQTLEHAITQFIGKKELVRVTAAGRTDTGVHALGQVVHFDADVERDEWSWVRGINTFLPNDVVVNWTKVVPPDFDARFSAHERTYIYAIVAGPTRSPTLAKRVGYHMMPSGQWFDASAMQIAADYLIGEPNAVSPASNHFSTSRYVPMPSCIIWCAILWEVFWWLVRVNKSPSGLRRSCKQKIESWQPPHLHPMAYT